MQNHRRLRVWRQAFAVAIDVRKATSAFPRTGYGELKAQMVSSAESVVHNIVEGCGAVGQPEFARFLEISIKSATELEGQLELCHAYGVLPTDLWRSLHAQVIDTRRMLIGLRKKILSTTLEAANASRDSTRGDD